MSTTHHALASFARQVADLVPGDDQQDEYGKITLLTTRLRASTEPTEVAALAMRDELRMLKCL
ncbi:MULTISPECIES: hypothetical protein [Micromonospora]|uniref:Uncharacterized protein n=1 Tax=Micromonospora sicca TaxID=2202420 RepID=A0A317DS45_9ACTN|nr:MULTISPECIES: hypothetical protein [unclassified Micromonospora]MBM0226670.1 hypothetical protein [Micromonospora sp. ATA51]PWR16890.1 hypothetical protein DKT69_03185 [Micromonospora sp. 4G51]